MVEQRETRNVFWRIPFGWESRRLEGDPGERAAAALLRFEQEAGNALALPGFLLAELDRVGVCLCDIHRVYRTRKQALWCARESSGASSLQAVGPHAIVLVRGGDGCSLLLDDATRLDVAVVEEFVHLSTGGGISS